MNAIRFAIPSVILLCTALAVPAHADSYSVPAPHITIDCAHPRLPTQHEVGRLLDQHNASQVYASRTRLMGEARRACRRGGVAQVRIVPEAQPEFPQLASPSHGVDKIAANDRVAK